MPMHKRVWLRVRSIWLRAQWRFRPSLRRQLAFRPVDDGSRSWVKTAKKYKTILAIVGATLTAAGVSSYFEVDANTGLLTVLTGDVLVVSAAIFAAAVTAAIYAKPAFDVARALANPAKIVLESLTVYQGEVNLVPHLGEDGRDIYTAPARALTLRVSATVASDDEVPRRTRCNILAVLPCNLTPVGPKEFRRQPDEPSWPLLPEEGPVPIAVVAGNHEVTEAVKSRFIVDLALPVERSRWTNGWPMRMTLTASNRAGFVIDHTFWIILDDEVEVGELRQEAAELESRASELRERVEGYERADGGGP
jgi:hypothetical protein